MSTTRTATLAILGSALSASLTAGTAGSAAAQPVWCEEAAPYGCSAWSGTQEGQQAVAARPTGMSLGEYAKLHTLQLV
jgi:hypothetical protein